MVWWQSFVFWQMIRTGWLAGWLSDDQSYHACFFRGLKSGHEHEKSSILLGLAFGLLVVMTTIFAKQSKVFQALHLLLFKPKLYLTLKLKDSGSGLVIVFWCFISISSRPRRSESTRSVCHVSLYFRPVLTRPGVLWASLSCRAQGCVGNAGRKARWISRSSWPGTWCPGDS